MKDGIMCTKWFNIIRSIHMKNILQAESVLQSPIDGALVGTDINTLFDQLCKKAVEVGVPLLRAHLAIALCILSSNQSTSLGGATPNWN
ncbi:MAG: hypothetical protein ACI9UN_002051 [Granulosicoccus sp.]|jgi:hypothetical protein